METVPMTPLTQRGPKMVVQRHCGTPLALMAFDDIVSASSPCTPPSCPYNSEIIVARLTWREQGMFRTLKVLFQRDPAKDWLSGRLFYEGYRLIWPDGRPV